MTPDDVLSAVLGGDGEEVVLAVSDADALLLSAVASAVTEHDDPGRWPEYHPGGADPEAVRRLLGPGTLIGRFDCGSGGLVGDFDGACMRIELYPDDLAGCVNQLRSFLDALRDFGVRFEAVS